MPPAPKAPYRLVLSDPANREEWVNFISQAPLDQLLKKCDHGSILALALDVLPTLPSELVAHAFTRSDWARQAIEHLVKWPTALFEEVMNNIYACNTRVVLHPQRELIFMLRQAEATRGYSSVDPGLRQAITHWLSTEPAGEANNYDEPQLNSLFAVCQTLAAFVMTTKLPEDLVPSAYAYARKYNSVPASPYIVRNLIYRLTLAHPKHATERDLVTGCSVAVISALESYIAKPEWAKNPTLAVQLLIYLASDSAPPSASKIAYLQNMPASQHSSLIKETEEALMLKSPEAYARLWWVAKTAGYSLPPSHFARFILSEDKEFRLAATAAAEAHSRRAPSLTR